MDFVVASLILNKDKLEQTKTKEIAKIKKKNDSPKQNICGYCGQHLPWFCVCYLSTKK